jgi:hypothetical protein
MKNNIDPLQQIEKEKNNEIMIGNLERLSKKYQRYNQEHINIQKEPNGHAKDSFVELIETKDDLINSLQNEINMLKQQLVDTTIIYNTKIEQLRSEHTQELHRLHISFAERLASKN